MAEHQLPKLNTGVRFPSPAPKTASIKGYLPFFTFSLFTLVSLFLRLPIVRSLLYSLFTFLSSLNSPILQRKVIYRKATRRDSASLEKGGGLPQASRRDSAELYGI